MSPHGTNVYRRITNELEQLDFFKVRQGRRTEFELPSNTYVAEFDQGDYSKSVDLADEIKIDLKRIMEHLNVHGRYFVFVGQKWAWNGGQA
jgi:hypothetical protein